MRHLQWDLFLERMDRNPILAQEIARDFIERAPQRWATLSFSLSKKSTKQIEYDAHALRGMIAPFGGDWLMAQLKEIEELARQDQTLSGLDTSVLGSNIDNLIYELRICLGDIQS